MTIVGERLFKFRQFKFLKRERATTKKSNVYLSDIENLCLGPINIYKPFFFQTLNIS